MSFCLFSIRLLFYLPYFSFVLRCKFPMKKVSRKTQRKVCGNEEKIKILTSYFLLLTFFTIFASAKVIKMIETLLFSVLIIAIAIAFLSIKVIAKKNGRFHSQHIHDSQAMKDRGIHCVVEQDREMRLQQDRRIKERI